MAAAPPAASPAARLYSGARRSAHPTPDNPQALCHAGGLWWVVLGCCAAAAWLDQACMAACSPGAPPALPLPLTCCAWLQGGARTRALEDASRSSRQRLTGAPASHALVSRHLSGVGGRMPAAGSEAAGGSGGCTSARAAGAWERERGVLQRKRAHGEGITENVSRRRVRGKPQGQAKQRQDQAKRTHHSLSEVREAQQTQPAGQPQYRGWPPQVAQSARTWPGFSASGH